MITCVNFWDKWQLQKVVRGTRFISVTASVKVFGLCDMFFCLNFVACKFPVGYTKVWIWTHLLGRERWWWTMPGKGEVKGKTDGGSKRYSDTDKVVATLKTWGCGPLVWGGDANTDLHGHKCKMRGLRCSISRVKSQKKKHQDCWSWAVLSGKANDKRNRGRAVFDLFSNFEYEHIC